MKQILITKARKKDIPALIKIEKSCFKFDQFSTRQFDHFIKSPSALFLVVKQKNQLIANAIILFRKHSTIARLYSIAVDPAFQHCGIAKKLCSYIERKLKKRRCSEIRLEVRVDNRRAICFYHNNGYESFCIYKKFYEDDRHALRMRKVLSHHMKLK